MEIKITIGKRDVKIGTALIALFLLTSMASSTINIRDSGPFNLFTTLDLNGNSIKGIGGLNNCGTNELIDGYGNCVEQSSIGGSDGYVGDSSSHTAGGSLSMAGNALTNIGSLNGCGVDEFVNGNGNCKQDEEGSGSDGYIGNSNSHTAGGNLDMGGNTVRNRGNYFFGAISTDNGGWWTNQGKSGTISTPSSGNTNCDSGNNVCLYNDGDGEVMFQFELPNRFSNNPWSGDQPTTFCWVTSNGDNEYRAGEEHQNARGVNTDFNGHCLGSIDDCAGGTTYDSGSHAIYGIACYAPR